MNSNTSAFWYRPLWQRLLPTSVAMILILFTYFYFYWQPIALQLAKLEHEIHDLDAQSQYMQITHQQLPSLELLNSQIVALKHKVNSSQRDPSEFITHLQQTVTRTSVVLNRLQPSTNTETQKKSYTIEVQGDYPQLYRFIHTLISPPTHQIGLLSGASFTPHNGQLAATLTISFITDDKNNAQ
ncbi:hypothetical protein [Providencia manganoxydans]|uniref:hypothetical protein n=1 Tax=Providencia manganoxydans TaxID=2923283 RepID=UPI00280DA360|nr:hypothetical protein [Providencia stuartii]ELR5084164.1 hypothetical protein [Providencia stuartii]